MHRSGSSCRRACLQAASATALPFPSAGDCQQILTRCLQAINFLKGAFRRLIRPFERGQCPRGTRRCHRKSKMLHLNRKAGRWPSAITLLNTGLESSSVLERIRSRIERRSQLHFFLSMDTDSRCRFIHCEPIREPREFLSKPSGPVTLHLRKP
jgi:hypothetical protein